MSANVIKEPDFRTFFTPGSLIQKKCIEKNVSRAGTKKMEPGDTKNPEPGSRIQNIWGYKIFLSLRTR